MRRHRYIHSVIVRRNNRTPLSGSYPNYSVIGQINCLVLALSNNAQTALIGRVEQASYTITWSDTALMDGDVIEYNGKNYLLREILDDTVGGYYTGVLQEFKGVQV